MKVILLKDIKGVGRKFEEKEVASGYALNFLIPKKQAVPVGSASASQIKVIKESGEKHKEAEHKKILIEIEKLSNTEITIALQANEKNHLFASLTKEKISGLLKEKGIELSASLIKLEQPIKETGTFTVPVSVGGFKTNFTLVVARA